MNEKGERSPNEISQAEIPEENKETDYYVTLPKDATMADLFAAIRAFEEEADEEVVDELHFNEELHDNFNPEISHDISDLEDDPEAAAKTKLVDFFRERGYDLEDIIAYLPIKFK